MTHVSDHAHRRIIQRIRPRTMGKTTQQIADDAYAYGIGISEASGLLRRQMIRIYRAKGVANNTRLFLGHFWVFAGDALITVWERRVQIDKRQSARQVRRAWRLQCRRWAS